MTLRALVTRPEEDAAPLAAALAERGIDVTLEPLLSIRPLPEAPIDLAGVQALLFTSANGVRSFAELAGGRDFAGWRELPVFAVGDATATAARNAGFARVESATGDVAALAKLVAERLDPKAGALFHAAGSAVAGDLAGLLERAGFALRREMLYEARPADQLSPATVTNLANGWFDLVLFFSPRTAATFVTLARAAGEGVVNGCGKAAALCLSQAVATAARELPWREVQAAARPELPALLDLIDRELAARAHNIGASEVQDAARPTGDTAAPPFAPQPSGEAASPVRATRSPWWSIVAVAAVVSLIVSLGNYGGALLLFNPSVEYAEPSPQTPAVAERLDALDRRLQGVESGSASSRRYVDNLKGDIVDARNRIIALESAAQKAQAVPPLDVAALTERLDKLESDIAMLRIAVQQSAQTTPAAGVSALNEKMAALEARLAALQTQPPSNGATVDTAAIDRISNENARLRSDLAALKTQLAAVDQALAARGQDTAGVAFVLAVSNLGAALSTARPFAAELTALTELAGKDPALAAQVKELTAPLAGRAAVGVPTLVELQGRFPATARAIVEAAKQPEPPTVENSESTTWYDRPLGWLSSAGEWLSFQVSVRPVGDVAGDDAGARVARAEVRLSENALAAAVKELEGLSGPAAAAAAAWLGDARARLAVDRVVTALQAAAVTRLGSTAASDSGG